MSEKLTDRKSSVTFTCTRGALEEGGKDIMFVNTTGRPCQEFPSADNRPPGDMLGSYYVPEFIPKPWLSGEPGIGPYKILDNISHVKYGVDGFQELCIAKHVFKSTSPWDRLTLNAGKMSDGMTISLVENGKTIKKLCSDGENGGLLKIPSRSYYLTSDVKIGDKTFLNVVYSSCNLSTCIDNIPLKSSFQFLNKAKNYSINITKETDFNGNNCKLCFGTLESDYKQFKSGARSTTCLELSINKKNNFTTIDYIKLKTRFDLLNDSNDKKLTGSVKDAFGIKNTQCIKKGPSRCSKELNTQDDIDEINKEFSVKDWLEIARQFARYFKTPGIVLTDAMTTYFDEAQVPYIGGTINPKFQYIALAIYGLAVDGKTKYQKYLDVLPIDNIIHPAIYAILTDYCNKKLINISNLHIVTKTYRKMLQKLGYGVLNEQSAANRIVPIESGYQFFNKNPDLILDQWKDKIIFITDKHTEIVGFAEIIKNMFIQSPEEVLKLLQEPEIKVEIDKICVQMSEDAEERSFFRVSAFIWLLYTLNVKLLFNETAFKKNVETYFTSYKIACRDAKNFDKEYKKFENFNPYNVQWATVDMKRIVPETKIHWLDWSSC